MDLSIIDKIKKMSKVHPEMKIVMQTLSKNGVDFKNKRVNLDKLIEYNNNTTINGILMTDKESILVKVCLSLLLFPQKEGNKINYLFGKGIGVEIALLGKCKDRVIDGPNFEPRSHSDFELYNTSADFNYSKEFSLVFGGQEYYPKTITKGLSNIPEDYMDKTYEVVDFFGIDVLVPSLEIMFVDKVMKQESTPRPEGCDALLLAARYQLDLDLVDSIYLKYNETPERHRLEKSTFSFEYLCKQLYVMLGKSNIDSINYMIKLVNKNKKLNTMHCGIPYKALELISNDDIVDGKLTENYLHRLKIKYNKYLNGIFATLTDNKNELESIISDSQALKYNCSV